jgi:acetyl-CoA acetyltransferase
LFSGKKLVEIIMYPRSRVSYDFHECIASFDALVLSLVFILKRMAQIYIEMDFPWRGVFFSKSRKHNGLINSARSVTLAIDTGVMGPTYSISAACATANYCLYAAANHIRRGEADIMLAGGTEASILPAGVGGFIACKALSKRNDDPQTASRPWDKDRDGFVMGEGAGMLVSLS